MYFESYKTSSKWTLFFKMRFCPIFITPSCDLFLIKLRWLKKKGIYEADSKQGKQQPKVPKHWLSESEY